MPNISDWGTNGYYIRLQTQMQYGWDGSAFWPNGMNIPLSQWRFRNGVVTDIVNMSNAQLDSAIRLLKEGNHCGGQESKIISLEKERRKRNAQ